MINNLTGISVSLCLMIVMLFLMVIESYKESKKRVKPAPVTPPRDFHADFTLDLKCLDYTIGRISAEQIDRKIKSANEFGYTEINLISIPTESDLDLINEHIEEGVDLVLAMLSVNMLHKLSNYYSNSGLRTFIRIHFRDVYMSEIRILRAEKDDFMQKEKATIEGKVMMETEVNMMAKQNDIIHKIAAKYKMSYQQMVDIRNANINSNLYKHKDDIIKNRNNRQYEYDVVLLVDNLKV